MLWLDTLSRATAARVVGAVLTLAAARAGAADNAESRCPESRLGRVVSTTLGLRVEDAAVPALRSGDLLIQLNSHRLVSCADLAEAMTEAQRNQLVPLILIRRDGSSVAAAVEWPAVAAVAPQATVIAPTPVPTALPTTIPTPPPTAIPTPLSRADVAAVRRLLDDLVAFGRDLQSRQPLPKAQPWVQRIAQLRQDYAMQAGSAGVGVVEPILDYYETIGQILIYKESATQERRDLRAKAEVVLDYHRGSSVETWLRRYPFLQPSVLAEPETFHFITEGESSGQWVPDRAVSLLLDRAVSEGSALSAKLATGGSN